MKQKHTLKNYCAEYFLIVRKCLVFSCLVFCFSLLFPQTFIHNKNFVHTSIGAKIYVENDTLTEFSERKTGVFIGHETEIFGLEYINSPELIVKQKNKTFSDKSAAKKAVYNKGKSRQITSKINNSSSPVSVNHSTSVDKVFFQPKSNEYFTIDHHCNNSAVIPVSNLNIKIAVLSDLSLSVFRNFTVESSVEIEYFFYFINKLLVNNYTTRPPPYTFV